MINGKALNRWGWLLTVSTILTALTIVPLLVESESLGWLEWLSAPGGLLVMFLKPESASDFMAAGAVALVVNMAALAAAFDLLLRGINFLKRRRLAHQ